MNIYISWSGDTGRRVALALQRFIPLILQRASVYSTADDMEKGTRWADMIKRKLDSTDTALLCVTPESVNSPWLAFEAGILSKSLGQTRIIPLLVGMSIVDVTGPLAMFQLCPLDRSSLKGLFRSLNSGPERYLPESILNQVFDAMWPHVQSELEAIAMTSVNVPETIHRAEHIPESMLDDIRSELETLQKRLSRLERNTHENRRVRRG